MGRKQPTPPTPPRVDSGDRERDQLGPRLAQTMCDPRPSRPGSGQMFLGGTKLGMHPIQTNPQYFVDHHRQIPHATKHLYNAEHASKPMLVRERTL